MNKLKLSYRIALGFGALLAIALIKSPARPETAQTIQHRSGDANGNGHAAKPFEAPARNHGGQIVATAASGHDHDAFFRNS